MTQADPNATLTTSTRRPAPCLHHQRQTCHQARHRSGFLMPIIRSGYATQHRNGSTRAYRKARAQTLAEETTCARCGQPGRADDPLVAGHIQAHAYGGTNNRDNLTAMHATCNNQLGALPFIA